jgi:hypothetical protein
LHDTKDFRCGSDSQDNFQRRTAKRQQRDGYTRLYVATDAAQTGEPRACLGFYAINADAIGLAKVPFDAAPRAPLEKRNALASRASTRRWGSGPC